jgi:hypothetical protein
MRRTALLAVFTALLAGCGSDGEDAAPPPPPPPAATTAARPAPIEQALEIVEENQSEAEFSGPASDAEIARAEELLGLEFPPSYRRFLAALGAGQIFGERFYGIVAGGRLEEPLVPNAVGVALEGRAQGWLPRTLLPVDSEDGFGYGIDFAATSPGGEHPVVSWRGSPESGTEVVAPDFGTFFHERIEHVS